MSWKMFPRDSQQREDWKIFHGDGQQREEVRFPEPPPWRNFDEARHKRGALFESSDEEIRLVNAAIHLRRPLLITGRPGSGKSSLAYAVAYELGLGEVLRWSITSRTTLNDGLYRYDAIGRLQDANLPKGEERSQGIGRYLRLGPLGTALAVPKQENQKPRVLLVDEIDKSDIDLPNDLLHIFEEGEFSIPELERLAADQSRTVNVRPADNGELIAITDGKVRCEIFPIVFFTSNGEREFPPAFYRRCLRLDTEKSSEAKLQRIVAAHLGESTLNAEVRELISKFLELSEDRLLATDQLLNAIFLISRSHVPPTEWQKLSKAIMRSLSGESEQADL
jgi:MoxR-like ATPase